MDRRTSNAVVNMAVVVGVASIAMGVAVMMVGVAISCVRRGHVALLRDRAHRLAGHGVVVTRAATDIHLDRGRLGARRRASA